MNAQVRRQVHKVNATHGYTSPKRAASSPEKVRFFAEISEDDGCHEEDPLDLLSPREKYLMNNAATKIQSIFKGRRARVWVSNQALRLFPLAAPVSKNFHSGGNRGKAIFLEKKRQLLLNSKKRLDETGEIWEKRKEDIAAAVRDESEGKAAMKEKLKLHKIQRRLDAEALMLHKNMRFIAACIIQNFCKDVVLEKVRKRKPCTCNGGWEGKRNFPRKYALVKTN